MTNLKLQMENFDWKITNLSLKTIAAGIPHLTSYIYFIGDQTSYYYDKFFDICSIILL